MSKSRVYGQQVRLFFSKDGITGEQFAEIDNFSAKHNDVVKKNSSLGETGVGSIDVLDDGGSLSFEAKKSDSTLINYFILQSKQNRANGTAGERGKTPYIKIIKQVTFIDGSVEKTTFHGVVLHSPDESVAGKNDEYVEKFEGEYKYRDIEVTDGEASETADIGKDMVTTALSKLADLASNINSTFPEVGTAVDYTA